MTDLLKGAEAYIKLRNSGTAFGAKRACALIQEPHDRLKEMEKEILKLHRVFRELQNRRASPKLNGHKSTVGVIYDELPALPREGE